MCRDLGLRLPRAPKRKLRAREGGGAHREASGGGCGVRDELQTRCRRRRGSGERKRGRVRWNPVKTRPKREISSTYGRVRSWRGSWMHRRRGFRSGMKDSPAAVVLGCEQRMGREGGLGSGFYWPGGARNKEGEQVDSVTCHAGATAVAFPAWPRHRRPKKGNRRGKRKEARGRRKERRKGR